QARRLADHLARHFAQSSGKLPALADIAYTLQSGREAFEHRLAVVASDAADLQAKLASFAAGGGLSADMFAGVASPDAEDAKRVDTCDLADLAARWAGGARLEWRDVLSRGGGIVSLPSYPFARERHWI